MSQVLIYIMSALYIFSGVMHFLKPAGFVKIMPPSIPWHYPLVYLSGAAEIILAILLIPGTTRSTGAWGIILLLIAVFPANIYMAKIFHQKKHRFYWLTILRLPFQIVLIWWAWQYT